MPTNTSILGDYFYDASNNVVSRHTNPVPPGVPQRHPVQCPDAGGDHPPTSPGELDAPQGEPTPTDNAASTILSVPRDPVDIYALIAIRPQDVKALRPRWSLGRCRRWLREYESRLRAVMHEHMCDILSNYLENTSGRLLNRDRENARQPSLSMPDLATWTQLINRPTWDNSPIQSNPTPPQRPHYA